MEFLQTKILKNLLLKQKEPKEKTAFYCTESETSAFEIYHRFKGTPVTNPIDVKSALGLRIRTMVEHAIGEELRDLGCVIEPPEGFDQHRVDMERKGVTIHGYLDFLIKDIGSANPNLEIPLEIKTSFGDYQLKELLAGKPKLSYLKQLAQYMDYKNVNKGYLLQIHFKDNFIIEGLYQFTLIREPGTLKFKCLTQEFNLEDTYNRYAEIYNNYILPDIEPVCEYKYKYDIETLDWKTIPTYKIGNARNNKAVLGDWQVTYSAYKDLIVSKEGTCLGYSDKELKRIKELTDGYTTWKRKKENREPEPEPIKEMADQNLDILLNSLSDLKLSVDDL